jgi:prophage regulatory protein
MDPLGFLIPADPQQESVMTQRLIRYEDLRAKAIPYRKPHIWRLEKAGKFPRRVPIGAGRYAYVEAEIDAYIDQKIAERDARSAA